MSMTKKTPSFLLLLATTAPAACSTEPLVEVPMGVRYAVAARGDLYVLNQLGGRVVRIRPDGSTSTVKVGSSPEALAATADGSWVVTLARESSTLWAVRTDGFDAHRVEIRPNHNVIAVSPATDSRHAVTFVDLSKLEDLDIDGSASLNEVTVVDLGGQTPISTSVVVGFNPKQVVFTGDGTRAVVLSESFASILDLDDPTDPVRIPLGANTTSDPVTPETALVTPDDRFALVARRDSADVFVIALDPPSVNIVDFTIFPTKFAASSDGTIIAAISHGSPTVAFFDVEATTVRLATAEGGITDAAVPLEAEDRRVLFWGLGLTDEQAYSYDLDEREMRTVQLVNAPTDIRIGPGGSAVVLQRRSPTFGGDETDHLFDVNDSLSLIDPEERLVTPHFLESLPIDVAFTRNPGGDDLAVVSLREAGRLAVVDLETLLIVSRPHVADVPRSLVPLGAPGEEVPVAVIHDQPWGLVTFLHPDGSRDIAKGFLLEDSL